MFRACLASCMRGWLHHSSRILVAALQFSSPSNQIVMDILPSVHLSLFKKFLPFRAPRMPAPFENLPNEILLNIFQRLRSDVTSRSFIDSLLVCSRCHEIGTKILWQDIVLTNDTIDRFVKHASSLPKCPPVRSLTVRLLFTRPTEEELSADIEHLLFKRSMTNPRMGVSDQLADQLADLIKEHFHSLSTFSIVIKRNPFEPNTRRCLEPECCVSSNLIDKLLRALPPFCTSVEIDTGGLDNCCDPERPPEHLCSTIRSLLPQLYHLRLRMHRYCPSLVDPAHDNQVVLNSETSTQDEPIHSQASHFQAPLLQTLILNLRPESATRDASHSIQIIFRLVRDRPHLCGWLPKHFRAAFIGSSPHHPNNLPFILAAALRHALNRNSFPAIKRLEIFNIRNGKNNSYLSRQDVLAAKTLILPLYSIGRDDPEAIYKPGGLYATMSAQHEQYFGLISAIEHHLEQAWHTTLSGSRFPTAFRRSDDAGLVWRPQWLATLDDFQCRTLQWQCLWVADDVLPLIQSLENVYGVPKCWKSASWNNFEVCKRWTAINWKKPELVQGCGREAFRNW